MINRRLLAAAAAPFLLAVLAFGQGTVIVNDPTVDAPAAKLSAADKALIDRDALPAIRQQFASDACTVELDPAGVIKGAFTRAGAKQTLTFFQICQTGNGMGITGLVLIEGGKIVGSFASDGGWSTDIARVADVNQNGTDEFVLAFSGGMHQGQGGTGVDLMEFSGGVPVGIGWYQAESFGETQAITAWKLTAKPGRTPVFYRQKYFSGENEKWRRVGTSSVFKLKPAYSKFTVVK